MDTYQILTVILSATLIVVLITVIVALYYIIKILQHVNRISSQAERVVDKVESVSEFFKQGAGVSSIARVIGALAETAMHTNKKRSKKE